MFCPQCGSEYAGNPNYCGKCGAKLSGIGVESPQKMTVFLSTLDSSKPDAHLLLLSKFLKPSDTKYFAGKDYWQTALGENPQQAIKRFLDEGMLVQPEPAAQLAYRFNVTELKAMLKKRGLPAAGRKDDLARRLVEADPDGVKNALAGLSLLLVCSTSGSEVAQEYRAKQEAMRREVEQQTMEYLRQHKFKEASITVAAYEAKQVFPRGLGLDWKHHDYARDVDALNVIFGRTPKILGKVDESRLEPPRLAAGMAHLWGTNIDDKWLPPGFESGLKMDNDAVARMFMFLGIHEATIAEYRRSGVVREVKILATGDSCEACVKLASGSYTLDKVPELPNEHCTSEMGCRCCFAPVIRR